MPSRPRPVTVPDFAAARGQDRRLAMLTAYDFPTAALLDAAGVDAILVGDSVGTVIQGRSSTLPVTLDQMIYHGEMVVRGVQRALVIVDLPFGSYQTSPQQAVDSGSRVLKETLCGAVKIEGGVSQARTIEAMLAAEIPVMGHVGLRPQAIRQIGGHKVQRQRQQLMDDAVAAAQAGAFAVVLELVQADIAADITDALDVPTIGIGSGGGCTGQVLVTPDMLGQSVGFRPKFLKRYAELHDAAAEAAAAFVRDVRDGTYPAAEHEHTAR